MSEGSMKMRRILLGLTITPYVGWQTIQHLILNQVDEQCLGLNQSQWQAEFSFLTARQTAQLSDWMCPNRLRDYEQQLSKEHITYITAIDDEYPKYLKEIGTPPWLFFLKGNKQILSTPSLAVVGSRKTTSYGRKVTQKMIPQLVQKGWTITSGLALGIDALAHHMTLGSKGLTMAVLGCGINMSYPPQNRKLHDDIEQKGLIVSEYPLGVRPHPGYFPQRNRIIAGLTYGTIVIEAAKKSGSLITSYCALENGREVFAVPGAIFDQQSVGTNLLIQQHGAKLITDVDDIQNEFNHLPFFQKQTNSKKSTVQKFKNINRTEKEVLKVLKNGKMHLNDIRDQTSLDFATLSKVLLTLELEECVQALPGSYYQKCVTEQEDLA